MSAVVSGSTILQCPSCRRRYCVDDDRLRTFCYQVRCRVCRKIFDARRVRLNPKIFRRPLPKEENHLSFFDGVCPTANLCETNMDDYTKIERVTFLDEASCFISLGTQLSPMTLMDESLTSFDSQDLSVAEQAVRESIFESQSGRERPSVKAIPVQDGIDHLCPCEKEDDLLTFSASLERKGIGFSRSLKIFLVLLFFVLFFSGIVFLQRDNFVGFFPSSYVVIQKISHIFGRTVHWPKKNSLIQLQAVEIRVDPQDSDHLLLTGFLRNTSDQNISFPDLEVLLLDADGLLLRKDFFPASRYLTKSNLKKGFFPQSQQIFRLFLFRNNLRPLDSFQVVLK